MGEVFQGLKPELLIGNICYDVEQTLLDNQDIILYLPTEPEELKFAVGELIISDVFRLYATMRVKFKRCRRENEGWIYICEIIPKSINFFKRSFLRLKTEIPVACQSLTIDVKGGFTPNETACEGVITDLNPCGAKISLNHQDFTNFFKKFKKSQVFLNLTFKITPEEGREEVLMKVQGKVASLKKAKKEHHLGVLFFIKTYQQYRFLEGFYNQGLSQISNREEKQLLQIDELMQACRHQQSSYLD